MDPNGSEPVLAGTVAVVTGAGQGVGRGVALAMAAAGAHVVAIGRTEAKLHAVAKEIEAQGATATVVALDVSERDAVHAAARRIGDELGHVDTLVNAAYDSRVGMFDTLTAADARHDWSTGFASIVWTTQAFHPLLAASHGSIINVGAATGLKPDTTTFALYASTKEAVRSFTRTAACELAPDVRVNALIPLATSPSFTQWAHENPDDYAIIVDSMPMKRMGDPVTDVGPVAVFLASAAAHYLTGTTLMADGGRGFLR
jgi:NAD(P)-dependent dehydrogenase (short-subunit alcohol dehydrogenase family)